MNRWTAHLGQFEGEQLNNAAGLPSLSCRDHSRLHQVQGAALLIDENLTTLEVSGVENVP